ncbi:unnamed protein product [Arabis nemorensis]|uniref:Uncharacterized protein n=1 Tax=Arabis nemorensis TaxID=586526 RepID=A0A565CEF3_9BRAS|nr:unnamed protein product [Arabis nemorensis]
MKTCGSERWTQHRNLRPPLVRRPHKFPGNEKFRFTTETAEPPIGQFLVLLSSGHPFLTLHTDATRTETPKPSERTTEKIERGEY